MKQHRSLFLSCLASLTLAALFLPPAIAEVPPSGIERDGEGRPVIVSAGKPLNMLAGRWGFWGSYVDKLGVRVHFLSLFKMDAFPWACGDAPEKWGMRGR
jgi:hypothetical protein